MAFIKTMFKRIVQYTRTVMVRVSYVSVRTTVLGMGELSLPFVLFRKRSIKKRCLK